VTGTPAWFEGAVDLHVHSRPSLFPRRFDDYDLARHAAEAKMASLVIKAHEGSTVERASLAGRMVGGIQVRGGIVLNRFVGGFNPHAVEAAIALGANMVWMPTLHAANHMEFYGDADFREQRTSVRFRKVAPLRALDDHSRLRPEVQEVLDVLASQTRVVLSNGHLGLQETRTVFREARRRGIERLLLAHPGLPLSGFDVDAQEELAGLGALIEHTYLPHLPQWGGLDIAVTAAQIRRVGVERCILASDLGQATSPPPAEGLLAFGRGLMEHGLQERDVRRMVVETPSGLLD
jgi:hypothetical protein